MSASPDYRIEAVGSSQTLPPGDIAIDAHVHLQTNMPFAQIAANFAEMAPGSLPVCLVVESDGVDRFAELKDRCEPWGALGLRDLATGIHFVAGRQVVSEEGLEVLLIGSRDMSLEGRPAERVIEEGFANGAAVCLPWGFGKWLGRRRDLVASLYAGLSRQITLGDIANRPEFWREPLFKGARILRGSDNLPMAGSSDGVGSFGSLLKTRKPAKDAGDLVCLLRDPDVCLRPYGKRKSASASIIEQVRLRLQGKQN